MNFNTLLILDRFHEQKKVLSPVGQRRAASESRWWGMRGDEHCYAN